MTQQAFSVRPRAACICGALLETGPAPVVKSLPQGDVTFRNCRECGSFIQAPVLTAEALTAWFDSADYQGTSNRRGVGYADYGRDEASRRAEAEQRYRNDLSPFLPPGASVFEVGCASGALLAELAKQGHKVQGCDLSPKFAATARSLYGLDVAAADWNDVAVPDASLDAVLLLGTVSGIDPLDRSLAAARRRLKATGFLFFNFPAADGIVARLYGSSFWMFTPSVMQFMTRRGVQLALERSGFRIESINVDRQAPSMRKLLGHMKLGVLNPLFERFGLLDLSSPIALPLPGIYRVVARPA